MAGCARHRDNESVSMEISDDILPDCGRRASGRRNSAEAGRKLIAIRTGG